MRSTGRLEVPHTRHLRPLGQGRHAACREPIRRAPGSSADGGEDVRRARSQPNVSENGRRRFPPTSREPSSNAGNLRVVAPVIVTLETTTNLSSLLFATSLFLAALPASAQVVNHPAVAPNLSNLSLTGIPAGGGVVKVRVSGAPGTPLFLAVAASVATPPTSLPIGNVFLPLPTLTLLPQLTAGPSGEFTFTVQLPVGLPAGQFVALQAAGLAPTLALGNLSTLSSINPIQALFPNTTFEVGSSPWDVAVADIDGDGIVDMAVAKRFSNDVTLLLGTGAGEFVNGGSVAFADGPILVAVADLDQDGRPDLMTGGINGDRLSTRLALPGGGWSPPLHLNLGGPPTAFVLADVDQDGVLDAVVTLGVAGNGSVQVATGLGNGTFAAPATLTAVPYTSGATVDDVDQDGIPDIVSVAGGFGFNGVLIHHGVGGGSFGPAIQIGTIPGAFEVRVVDLDLDGDKDLAVCQYTFGSPDNVRLLYRDATGNYGTSLALRAGSGPQGIAVGDLNGDALPDLAVAAANGPNCSVFLTQPGGGYASPLTLATSSRPVSV